MDDRSAGSTTALSRWQPWAAFALTAFALHWTWEMVQAPLYESMRTLSLAAATWQCTAASVGDVALTLLAYAAVAAAAGRTWLLRPRRAELAGYLAVGLLLTAALELLSVRVWGRWSYAPGMPRVLGVGLAPLLQWIVVPLATLWIVRRHLARRVGLTVSPARSSHTPGGST